MNLSEEKKILKNKGYKLIEVYGNSDSEILADPSFWDYSKQVQDRFKTDGGFIIKPEEQEKLLNNRYYINILKDNSIRLPKQYIQRFTQPFVEKIILACYKGNMNVKDAAYYLGEFSYQAGTMVKSDWEQWVARQLSTFNESINKQLKLRYNMKLNEAIKILKKAGFICEDTDEYDDADLGLDVDPTEYHKRKAKRTSLSELDDSPYDVFRKPTPYKISDSAAVCKNPTFKKRYQKELLALFDSSKTPDDFFEKCTKVYEKYNDLYDELDDKIVDMEDDGKKVPEDLKYKKNFYDAMGNALSEWDFGNWPGDMVLKCNNMGLARQMIVHLFENDFSLESAMEVYNELKTKR